MLSLLPHEISVWPRETCAASGSSVVTWKWHCLFHDGVLPAAWKVFWMENAFVVTFSSVQSAAALDGWRLLS